MNEYVVRFSLRQRIEHFSVMVLFTVLAITGLSQKFFDNWWAARAIAAMGGIDRVRWIHRAAGVLFAALAIVHFAAGAWLVLSRRSSASMVPTRKDFRDAVVALRYYLRISDVEARFDRFDYRQKFEYWGLVLGGLVMMVTGFILLYPVTVARWLPGQLIPAAKIAHSNEGLLAFLVVITWHIFNAHLSPEVFPFDPSIFSGKLSRERMAKEHPLEYARIRAAEEKPRPQAGETP